MLNKFRGRNAKRILWGLICIIVPAFVLWGASSLKGRKRNTIGTINNQKITASNFNRYIKLAQIHLLLNMQEKRKINRRDIEDLGLNFLVLLWKAKQEEIEISDQAVIEEVSRNFSPQGKFDKDLYKNFLDSFSTRYNLTVTPRNFEEYIRQLAKIDKLFQKHIDTEFVINDEEVLGLYKKDTQEAKIAYLSIPYEKFETDTEITPREIEEFYQENKSLFSREPKINIKYVIINRESDLKNRISQELHKLDSIDKLGEKFSLEIKETGFIGLNDPIAEIGWQPQINKFAFSLEKNTISAPLPTEKGLLIIEKKEEKPSSIPPLEEIKTEVKKKLIENNAKAEAKRLSEELLSEIKEKEIKDLSEFASEKNIEFKETDYFKYYDRIEGLGADRKINEMVFSLKEEEIHSEAILLAKRIFIIQLKNITPLSDKDFEEKKQTYYNRIKYAKEARARMQFLIQIQKEANLKLFPRNQQLQ